jgi:hypothetical protein
MRSSRGRREHHETRTGLCMADLADARELFWQNVTREMLTSLSMQRSRMAAEADAARRQLVEKGAEDPGPAETLPGFDGRMAIVTRLGERIPIADITPLFACSIGGSSRERALSEDVQCTVFQVRTPSGEVYTFPVHEIRGIHALTEEAMQSLQSESGREEGEPFTGVPFGFAAFTSLARDFDAEGMDGETPADDPDADPDADPDE